MKITDQINKTAELFLNATQEGNIFLFDALLEPLSHQRKIAKIVDTQYQGNALHWAANNGHIDLVERLINTFPELLDSQTKNGSTAILNAVTSGHTEIAKFLSEKNANLTIKNQNNDDVFSIAAQKLYDHPIKKYFQELRDSLNQKFIDAVNNKQSIQAAQWLDKGADIEIALRKGNDNDNDNKINYTAFFHACATGDIDMVNLLMSRHANINVIGGKNGFTPLHAAVFFGYPEIIKLLIAAKANMIKDANGLTPLELAQKQNISTIIGLFPLDVKNEIPVPKTMAKTSLSNTLKTEIFTSLHSSNTNTMECLEKRFNDLKRKSDHLSNSVFSNPELFSQEQPSVKNEVITLDEIRERINSLSTHGDNIKKEGKVTIEGFNAKCQTEGRKVDNARLEEYSNNLQKYLTALREVFSQDDVNTIASMITTNGIISVCCSIQGMTSNMYRILRETITPSQEYINSYQILFTEMQSLQREANKLVKKITAIEEKHLDISLAKNNMRLAN